jgi:hypothetical protein
MKCLVVEQPHGVDVVIPTPEYLATHSWDEFVADSKERDANAGKAFVETDTEALPTINKNSLKIRQRTYRDAWIFAGGNPTTDMHKAKQIHLKNIRALRDAELKKLDPIIAAAAITKADVSAELAKRQALLDATESVKAKNFVTPESLYSEWPTILEKRGA